MGRGERNGVLRCRAGRARASAHESRAPNGKEGRIWMTTTKVSIPGTRSERGRNRGGGTNDGDAGWGEEEEDVMMMALSEDMEGGRAEDGSSRVQASQAAIT